ncbi:MAG: hypothetical protein AB7G24_00785 [Novosphingobium sp.]
MLDRNRFTPPWRAHLPEGERPVYILRPGTVLERDQFEAELDGRHRAGQVFSFQLVDSAERGIRALLPQGAQADALVEAIRAQHSGQELAVEEQALVKAAIDILAEHWPEYRGAAEQEARRNNILPTLAFLRWCCGWENVTDADGNPVEYSRTATGEIPEDIQRRLNFLELRSAGLEAYAMQYAQAQAKNSASPSKSSPHRGNSTSRGGSKAGGKSADGTLKKTRASGARSGR